MPPEFLPNQNPDPFPPASAPSFSRAPLAQFRPAQPDLDESWALEHRQLREGEFWREVPKFARVDAATFLDPQWQQKNSVRSPGEFAQFLEGNDEDFVADVEKGLALAPMSIRITPYILALIDWSDPRGDRIRRQFLPLASERLPDHPISVLDALEERGTRRADRLSHRYPDRVLLISVDVCPVYCRYCTRSYSVGANTHKISKFKHVTTGARWAAAFEYIRNHMSIEDVVISGGDTYMLKPEEVRVIGHTLLEIPHIRRMRFATKGLGVLPMKLLGDSAWLDALTEVAQRGRSMGKEISVHTHIAHPSEITSITAAASRKLWERAITVRNQAVVLRNVNDDVDTLKCLIRRLSYINIHPYYMFQHDFVPGVEALRTPLHHTLRLEKNIRGATAGYNMPTFVTDLLGGGGKRDAHSYEHYDRMTGVSVYVSPVVDPNALYFNFDPLDTLPAEGQERWTHSDEIPQMLQEARDAVRLCQ